WASLCAGVSTAHPFEDHRLPPGTAVLGCRIAEADIASDGAWGGASEAAYADIPLNQWLSVELLARRQQTELITDHGVFRNDEHFADLDIDYYHVGILFQIPSSRVVPYFVASLGLAHLDLDLPDTSKEDRGSASLGGGVKIYFNDHVGLRFEGRGYYIDLDNDNNDDNRDDRRRRDRWDDRNSITQTEASLGLILAF
nr:outer membrane beta-barrel protein [Thermoanaerobaculia bacterium]